VKFIDIVGTAIRSTFRSKLRTTLTVIAIFIGAFTLTITSAIGTGVSDYINTQVTSIGASNVMTVTKAAAATSSTGSGPQKYSASTATGSTQSVAGPPRGDTGVLTTKDISTITAITGVLTVQPSVRISPDWISYASNGKYVLSVNGNAQFINADLAAGKQLSASSSADQVMLPTTYLKNMGLGTAASAIGKTVTVGLTDYLGGTHTVTATVVGVQNESLFSSGVGFNTAMTKDVQALQNTGKPASVTTSYGSATITFATTASPRAIAALKSDLKAAGYTGQTVADQLGTFELVINGIVGVLDAFAIIALIAAGFGIINTLLMSVQERTREIGLMKAMGLGGGRIFAMFSIEAIFIGFLGSAIGAGVAIGIGSVISRVLSRTLLSGLPGLHLLQFAPTSIVTIILVVMLIAFLAGTLPARRAARQNPIDALRYE
jgi:putative ABC transport system permease protein